MVVFVCIVNFQLVESCGCFGLNRGVNIIVYAGLTPFPFFDSYINSIRHLFLEIIYASPYKTGCLFSYFMILCTRTCLIFYFFL
jgi:hypothetical protein